MMRLKTFAALLFLSVGLSACASTSQNYPAADIHQMVQGAAQVTTAATQIVQQACAEGIITDPKVCAGAATAWFFEQAIQAAVRAGDPELVAKLQKVGN
jgi:hypothetical protein